MKQDINNKHVIVKNLKKSYLLNKNSFLVLDNLNFSVKKGEVYGLIGLSGAGKSTLIRCLNRLTEPDEGSIYIDNQNVLNLSKKDLQNFRSKVGMIFQHYHLFSQKTVFENIAFPLHLLGVTKEEIEERVNELLNFVSLTEKKDAYPSTLSGGQKQRVAIARALASKPTLLLSDEATSALDPSSSQQILDLLKEAVKRYQMTLILITHQLEVAKSICDKIAVLDKGRIIEENTVEELFRNPKHELTMRLIHQLPLQKEEIDIFLTDYLKNAKGRLFRLSYDKQTLQNPILSWCQKKHNVEINLLQGQINTFSKGSVGTMVVEITGENEVITDAIFFLKEHNINVLELKNV